MKKIGSYLLAVCLLATFSCQNKNKKTEPENIRTLVIGAMSSMDFIPVAVAQKMGYFNENGLNVTIQKFYSANERDAAFQGEIIDGTVIDYTGAILQKAGGMELKLTSACNAPFGIVASPQSNIRSVQDLKGKKISISRNTVIDFCMDMAIQSTGLPEAEIEKVEINKIPLRFEMLMKNEIQATALPDPFLTMAKSKGCPVIMTMDSLGYTVTGIMFSQKSIDEKRKEIQLFYNAYNRAVEYISTHSAADIKDILITDVGFPEELIPAVKLPAYSQARIPMESDIQTTINWLVNRDLIPNNFIQSEIIDSQFVNSPTESNN